jgi:predicted phosphoadenosine phosphosulfate sulfurtransferase
VDEDVMDEVVADAEAEVLDPLLYTKGGKLRKKPLRDPKLPKEIFVKKALVEIDNDVYTAALERIRWLWDEFDGAVSVSISGGKDSVVVMELAAIVARERGQKLKVQFLDQEAEWQATRDYLRELKDTRDDIDFDWYQIPFRLFNAASHDSEWSYMWPEEEPPGGYLRPPEHDSIRVNDFGVDRFKDVLAAMNKRQGGVHLTGMRADESPTRRLGMTSRPAYKWATWGAGQADGTGDFYLMHPIYDWDFRDIWKAIEFNGWKYNRLYDELYRYGVHHRAMRVSSLIHSGSVRNIEQIQEIEPATWERMTTRFEGVNAAAHVGEDSIEEFRGRRPYMFDTWIEYLDYLIDHLIEPEHREQFRNLVKSMKSQLPWMHIDRVAQKMIPLVMKNDYFSDYSFGKLVTSSKNWADSWEREHGPLTPDSQGPIEN